MGILFKLVGYAMFALMAYAVYTGSGDPEKVKWGAASVYISVALGFLAVGYLADIQDALEALKPEKPKTPEPPAAP